MKTPKRALHSQRGSALIVALLLTIGLAVMLASYHSLIHFNLRSSHRSYHSSAAMNLAETGLEEGMYAINKKRANPLYTYVSDGWTVVGDIATREFSNAFAVGTASETYVKVQITNCNLTLPYPARPTIKTQARLSLPNGIPAVTKWVEVTLDAPSSGAPIESPPTPPGLLAKKTITFSGNNASVDSWNSDPNKTGAMTHHYDSTTKNDQGFVGSVTVATDTVIVSNANIKGYVATATNNADNISDNVGRNGSILADDSPAGTKIDPTRISTDFTASIPDITEPTGVIVYNPFPASGSVPQSTDIPTNGKYYYSPGDISLNGTGETVSITRDDVVLVVSNLSITGNNGGIAITTGASLEIYASGDVKIAGNGVANGSLLSEDMQQPIKFKLWGTAVADPSNPGESTQNIDFAGNGEFSGIIYAPNADVAIKGNGDIMGSVVANNINLNGNAQFHYDEALGQFAFGTKADTKETALTIYRWRELIAASETKW